ncbi:hypothetical protein B9Z55_006901 [Caenorhabditis nigoni]|uniref:BTB domain-containing protein n=1 Tax=Caenorhabditis nigoni TaxID=1611254 RepID=A0A2G5V728_9PELO|nr:hypothetical protein B9Z55_006901 [Caenorhabditis nigoni]
MTTKEIFYKSGQKKVNGSVKVLETGAKDGLKHTWAGYVNYVHDAIFTWKFDWEDLKNQGVDRLVGHLIVHSVDDRWSPHRVDIDCSDTNKSISTTIGTGYSSHNATFEYNLTAHFVQLPPPEKNIAFEEMFAASDKTDVVLVVEGEKLNVNKSFLSIHSDYFSALFSANFKEGQMKEIEIKEISYNDFALLLSIFHPNPQFPNDQNVEKLLETARRFQVPSVTAIVEHHLLKISKIRYEKMLWLADEYVMPKLLAKCISQMNSLQKAKNWKKSSEYNKLSDKTKLLIFERLLEAV